MFREALEFLTGLRKTEYSPDGQVCIRQFGTELVDLEPYQQEPRFRAAAPKFQSPASFIEYVKTHKTEHTRLFFQSEAAHVVFDHLPAQSGKSRRLHHARLTLETDPLFAPWRNAIETGRKFGQAEFADFIDDHRAIILRPDAATIAETALNLQDNRQLSVQSKVNRANGRFSFTYSEGGDSGQASVPEGLTLQAPIFRGDVPVDIDVKIRYRLAEGKVAFYFVAPGFAAQKSAVVDRIAAEIGQSTDLPVLFGVDG